jgi:hypothetical protein
MFFCFRLRGGDRERYFSEGERERERYLIDSDLSLSFTTVFWERVVYKSWCQVVCGM